LISALVLALGSLGLGAAERGPVVKVASPHASAVSQGRVIVKYRSGGSQTTALSLRVAPGAQQASALGSRLGLSLRDGRAMTSTMQVVMAEGMNSARLAQQLAQDSNVEWAVPDERRKAVMVPNDSLFGTGQASPYPAVGQWYLRAYDAADPINNPLAGTQTTAAWDTTQGAGVVVAVLDTGVRSDHPDLAGRFLPGYNMISLNTAYDGNANGLCVSGNGSCRNSDPSDPGDWVSPADVSAYPTLFDNTCLVQDNAGHYVQSDSTWHGTQTAGIVGASTNNGSGIASMAPAAKILPIRVLGKCGGLDSDIIDGMRWAAGLSVSGIQDNTNPARVISLSLGSAGSCSQAYQSAINEIISQKGAVIVAAAGNDGLAVGTPANCSGVVAVAGVRHTGTKVGYSDLGPQVAISAPAGNCVNNSGACLYPIVTTTNSGTTAPVAADPAYSDAYNASLGTSFSTPMVAGAAALMLSANAALTPSRVAAYLRSSAAPFPSSGAGAGVSTCIAPTSTAQTTECYCTETTCGSGFLNAAGAVSAAQQGSAVALINAPDNLVKGGASLSLDAGASVASIGASIASYAWAVTSGVDNVVFSGSTTASKATVFGQVAGSVVVQLTVTDSNGHTALKSFPLTVTSTVITPTPPPPTSGGGGGGALGPLWALGLLGLTLSLQRRRQWS
jgi:serine protease